MQDYLQSVHKCLDALYVVFVPLECTFTKLRTQPQRRTTVDCLEKDLLQDLVRLHNIKLATFETSDGSAWELFLKAFR